MGEIALFEFRQCANIPKFTGVKAKNIHELRDGIATVNDDSIFHHTYQYFLKGHVLEYTNDFAHWAGESLEERALSEHLSNIDPYEFRDINELRHKLLDVIDGYLEKFPEPREVIEGDEFYFHETITLIFPAGVRARNLAEFLMALKYVDTSCIYYHFYEARVRLGEGTDDFSRWVEFSLGKKELADKIRCIDLFMHTIEGVRARIADLIEEELKLDMEVTGTE